MSRLSCQYFLDHQPKPTPGVYIFWLRDTAIYVGEAANLFQRVRFHITRREGRAVDPANQDALDFFLTTNIRHGLEVELIRQKTYRKVLEAKKIEELNPMFNSRSERSRLDCYRIESPSPPVNKIGNYQGKSCACSYIPHPSYIEKIRSLLKNKPRTGLRDLLLFEIAINNHIPKMDLIRELKVGQLTGLRVGQHLELCKTKKEIFFLEMNKTIFDLLQNYIKKNTLSSEDYLFMSDKTREPLTKIPLGRMVQHWCKDAGLQGVFGWQTLCKTYKHFQKRNRAFI